MGPDRPNIILIVSDTLRVNELGCYGNPDVATPNIDAFAESAVRFTRAFPESLPTIPVRRALHTGRRAYPFRDYKPVKWDIVYLPGWQPMDSDEDTVAENLAEAGYHTGFVTDSMPYFAPGFNFTRGFYQWEFVRGQQADRWCSPRTITAEEMADYYRPIFKNRPNMHKNIVDLVQMHLANTAHVKCEDDTTTARVFDWATRFVEENNSEDPFFLLVDCFDPHEPWAAPEKYYSMYADGEYTGRRIVNCRYGPIDDFGYTGEEVDEIRRQYKALVSLVDARIGRLFDKLDELGLAEDTAVLFVSDHGTNLCENPRNVLGKPADAMYPGVMRLPFIAKVPGVAAGVSDDLVYNLDATATIYDLAGIESACGLDGKSLLPLLRGEADAKGREYITCRFDHSLCYIDDETWALGDVDGNASEIFDLATDPDCQRTIVESGKDRWRKAWERLLSDAGGEFPVYRGMEKTDAVGTKL
ncbi:MAG: sulfatase [Planctomycetota bacterium]|jgi:arylsulfatase A-like enzyme